MIRILLTAALIVCAPLMAEAPPIEALKTTMAAQKEDFDKSLKAYEAAKAEVETLRSEYAVATEDEEKNRLAKKINQAQKELTRRYEAAVAAKRRYNATAYELAGKRHEILSTILAEEEMIVAQKEHSCQNLSLEECKQKAYDATKKEVEKHSNAAILKRAQESGIEIAPEKIESGVRYNIQSYTNLDEGYFYALQGDVNGELVLDERQMFDVETITWNEMFEEPEEVAQIPLDNLDTPDPEAVIPPEEVAPSVYHSGWFVSGALSLQDHALSGGGNEGPTGLSLSGGFKAKNKDRYYASYEYISGSGTDITYKGFHVDWAMDLGKAIYPFWGLGYSVANLEGDGYRYEGSAYQLRIGGGYEIRDDWQVDALIGYDRLVWVVANGDTNILDLGIYRDVMRYSVNVSYLF